MDEPPVCSSSADESDLGFEGNMNFFIGLNMIYYAFISLNRVNIKIKIKYREENRKVVTNQTCIKELHQLIYRGHLQKFLEVGF